MTPASLDRLLAVLIVALAITGLGTLRSGAPDGASLFTVHGILAVGLAVAGAVKVKRSLPKAIGARNWGRVALGLGVSFATAAALVGGFAWVASGQLLTIGSWTVLTIHAWIGLALLPVVAIHLLPRRWRLLVPRAVRGGGGDRRRPFSRRQVLAGGAFAAMAIALYGAVEVVDRLMGGTRRFTGSRWLPAGGVPPPTTFYGEGAPPIDPVAWRLRVHGRVAPETAFSLADLTALGEQDMRATLDCTSGWAMETTWRGVPLSKVLAAAGAQSRTRSIAVRSATGYATALNPSDIDRAFLATGVSGKTLPVANGAPCRLVVPDHRGLDWIKWVTEIQVV
jgi:DMSO/TMAO reductase YedYZ molybdopterin-dependent catalytic subunit